MTYKEFDETIYNKLFYGQKKNKKLKDLYAAVSLVCVGGFKLSDAMEIRPSSFISFGDCNYAYKYYSKKYKATMYQIESAYMNFINSEMKRSRSIDDDSPFITVGRRRLEKQLKEYTEKLGKPITFSEIYKISIPQGRPEKFRVMHEEEFQKFYDEEVAAWEKRCRRRRIKIK